MDEQCIDCGHYFDIHLLKNGLCSECNCDYVEDIEIPEEYENRSN
jgi:predicted  nucleic acid-binding Zn-ribbon protein